MVPVYLMRNCVISGYVREEEQGRSLSSLTMPNGLPLNTRDLLTWKTMDPLNLYGSLPEENTPHPLL